MWALLLTATLNGIANGTKVAIYRMAALNRSKGSARAPQNHKQVDRPAQAPEATATEPRRPQSSNARPALRISQARTHLSQICALIPANSRAPCGLLRSWTLKLHWPTREPSSPQIFLYQG